MLYDPKWEQKTETKAEPFTLASLIAWLEKQPAGKSYNYDNCRGRCLVGIYAQAMGFSWFDDSVPCRPEFSDLNQIAYGDGYHTHTFGAALERAKALV